jgi:hypothetical protein
MARHVMPFQAGLFYFLRKLLKSKFSAKPLALSRSALVPVSALESQSTVRFQLRHVSRYTHSTELMRRMRRYELAQKRCLLIKYAKDNRYESNLDQLVTHDRCVCYRSLAGFRTTSFRVVSAPLFDGSTFFISRHVTSIRKRCR